jgi:formate C-acetyltransferase
MTPAQPADTVAILGQTFGVTTFPGQAHRLPAETRHLAARVLAGEYGREMANATFSLSPADDALPPELRSARAIRLIAEQAPLRIRPDERLAGSAPLLKAVFHQRPCLKERSTSHTTIGFERALREGIGGYRARIAERRERNGLSEAQREFLQAMEECIDAMGVWHTRLLAGLDELGLTEVRSRLVRVPEAPPQTFGEAVQALWFLWEFQRLCGNWSGLGRMDKMLGPYLARDLAEGRIDLDDARDLLAHFWIKGAEWMGAKNGQVGSSGDAQFYQNVILGGVDETGEPIVNEVTYLILDIVEELHISDFPVAVRVHSQTPDELWRRIAEVQRLGGGIVSIYNDDVVIPALVGFGYPIGEARDYTNDGCWEVLIPGRTAFGYRPFDLLPAVQKALGLDSDAEPPDDQTFETVYARFHAAMAQLLEESWDQCGDSFQTGQPSPLLSLLVDDCIERAQPYHGRGARYSVRSPHAGGMPDAANSLRAIQVLVYEQKRLTLPEFVRILRAEWEGHEELRREISRDLVLYGNDDPQADAMLRRVFDDYTALCASQPERNGVRMPAGISTFGRELQFRDGRTATPFGAKRGDILAPNLSPTPGTDRKGPTAIVNSLTKVDFTRLPCGTPLDLKLHPSAVAGKAGLTALVALLRSFVARGGFYLQLDVADAATLRDAQKRPELYPNLSVRVSGWSARFTTLSREWQEMIIQRTEQHFAGQ